jgi:hypothetical protein
MRRALFGGMIAGALGLTVTVAAQNPPSQPPPRTPTTQDQPRTPAQGATVTVEGCVMREADVPGRKPNVAERAGVGEDYILTNSKMVRGSLPGATPATQNVMFEIEGIDDARLKQNVGRRVQLEGAFENVDRSRAAPEPGTPADDLVEFRATSIKQVAGDCQPKK